MNATIVMTSLLYNVHVTPDITLYHMNLYITESTKNKTRKRLKNKKKGALVLSNLSEKLSTLPLHSLSFSFAFPALFKNPLA